MAEEKGYLTDAYDEVYKQSQRIRERQADYILQKNEIERNQAEFEWEYENPDTPYEERNVPRDRDWDDYRYEDD
jgi:hypothetical protein